MDADKLAAALDRLAIAVERLADNRSPERAPKMPKVSVALAILTQHPEWSDQQIAKAAGCSRTTLYRSPQFRGARAALASGRTERARGTKYNGQVEAYGGDDGDDRDPFFDE